MMVSGQGSSGRGGGQIGRGGSSARSSASPSPAAGEKTEAQKIRSDAARIRGSYRYHNYRIAPPPAFAKRESDRYRYRRRRASSPYAESSASSSRQRSSTTLVVKMEEDTPLPQFAPDDYPNDDELERLLPRLGVNGGLAPGDFVEERNLDTVLGLVECSSQHAADKDDEWWSIAEELGKVFVGLDNDVE